MSNGSADAEVRIAKFIGYKIIAKKATRTVLWLFVVALVVYLLIAATMTRFVATDLGSMKIVSPNFPGGHGQPGTEVVIDPLGGHDGNPLTNIITSFSPHRGILIGEIIEGPYGKPDWASYNLTRDREDVLSDQYIMRCLEGCSADVEFIIVGADQIMGIPVRS